MFEKQTPASLKNHSFVTFEWKSKKDINSFLLNVPPENLWFSSVLSGYKTGTLARNGLKQLICRSTIKKKY